MKLAPAIGASLLVATAYSSSTASPPDTTGVAKTYKTQIALADTQADEGRFGDAEKTMRELLPAVERAYGEVSNEASVVLTLLVEFLWQGGKTQDPETVSLAKRALDVATRVYGPDDLETTKSHNSLGIIYEIRAEFTPSEYHYRRVIEIRRKQLPPDDYRIALAMDNHAHLLQALNRLDEALAQHRAAYPAIEKQFGHDDNHVAINLHSQGNVLRDMGRFEESEAAHREALAIRRKVMPAGHPRIARSLSNLGAVLINTGEYREAYACLSEAAAIMRANGGESSNDYANIELNMGGLAFDLGDYSSALQATRDGVRAKEASNGPAHPEVAVGYIYLATLQERLGSDAEAENHARHAIELVAGQEPYREEHAYALEALARVLTRPDSYARGDSLFRLATSSFSQLAPDHKALPGTMIDWARLLLLSGKTDEAERKLEQAVELTSAVYGERSKNAASSYDLLASIALARQDLEASLDYSQRSLDIAVPLLGEGSFDVAMLRLHRAYVLGYAKRYRESLALAVQADRGTRSVLKETAMFLPEDRALDMMKANRAALDWMLSLALYTGDEAAAASAWDALCDTRALVLDEAVARSQAFALTGDDEVQKALTEWRTSSEAVANLTMRILSPSNGSESEPDTTTATLLRDARARKLAAEETLAARGASLRSPVRESVTASQVLDALPAGSALVSYVSFSRIDFDDLQRELTRSWVYGEDVDVDRRGCYAAIVGTREDRVPRVVRLGSAGSIDSLVQMWRARARPSQKELKVLGGRTLTAYRAAAEALRVAVYDPIVAVVNAETMVFAVPDGQLNLVNFAALPTKTGDRFLVEEARIIHYLSSERDLLANRDPRSATGGALLLGAPDFDAKASAPIDLAAAERGVRSMKCQEFKDYVAEPLPFTMSEVKLVAGMVRKHDSKRVVEVLTGADASEAKLRQDAPGKSWLHIATHGFFLSGDCSSLRARPEEWAGGEWLGRRRDTLDPQLMSGLVLAGFNARTDSSRVDDGILTASEVGTYDLGGVEWAVLSACETGVGAVQAGEGVLGLRRAFHIAGARTLIMSLWSVPDEAARDWMKHLYRLKFAENRSTCEAVTGASRSILAERRRRGESTHPYYWAGFVAEGDWR